MSETTRDAFAHTRDEDFKRMVSHAAHLCEVALRPTAIDFYADEKLVEASGLINRARQILSREATDA